MMFHHAKHTPFWFTRALASCTLGLLSSFAAHAHEGHGLPGVSHWHATDVGGFAMAAVVAVGVAIWMKGRDK